MGYPPPRPPLSGALHFPFPMNEVPARLDAAADATFDEWVALPKDDLRTIEEFAEQGGRPGSPPSSEVFLQR